MKSFLKNALVAHILFWGPITALGVVFALGYYANRITDNPYLVLVVVMEVLLFGGVVYGTIYEEKD